MEEMAQTEPISPKVATPLAHRKRRFSAVDKNVIDLTGDSEPGSPVLPKQKTNGHAVGNGSNGVVARNLEDDEDVSEDDKELFQDILDTAELEPYEAKDTDGEEVVDSRRASQLRRQLLRVGPRQFIEETLECGAYTPVKLGTVFGLYPHFIDEFGEDFFLRILGAAILRAYNKRQKLPQYNTIDDAAALLRKSQNIMVITGAGISTSLGIPDFRSKETGFYSKLLDMGVSEPEEVFDIDAFDYDPRIFYELAADILPDLQRYSPTHGFVRLLQDKGKLQTNYTQNIDNLEELAGIDKHRLIQCHGSFAMATCRKCQHKIKGTEIFDDISAKQVSRCQRCTADIAAQQALGSKSKKRKPRRSRPNADDDDSDDDIPEPGVMKPDITFFGEQLPTSFFDRFSDHDSQTTDLVLVIGTSLKVAPVSEMPNYLPHNVPHIYISREPIEHVNFDIQLLGNCDDVVFELCKRAGWELKHEMISTGAGMRVQAASSHDGSRWEVRPEGIEGDLASMERECTNEPA